MTDTSPCDHCEINSPVIAAHRGASRRFPENSLAAIKEALNIAMVNPSARFFIEVDVRASKDGQLVLMHDSDVSRTTYGSGQVERMSFADIQMLQMKPIAAIVPVDKLSSERVENPFFTITSQDNRVASLNDVIALASEANEKRTTQGSPVGLAMHIKPKPPTKHFSKLTEDIASMLSAIIGKLGFPWIAKRLMPKTPAIEPLADLLNSQVIESNILPLMTFSAAGQVGKRDMKALWKKLSVDAKLEMMHESNDEEHTNYLADNLTQVLAITEPHNIKFDGLSPDKPWHNHLRTIANKVESFWLIGSVTDAQKDHISVPVRTYVTALDSPEDLKTAVKNGSTFVTVNYPQRAIETIRKMHSEHAQTPSPLQPGLFAELEMKRRQSQASNEPERLS